MEANDEKFSRSFSSTGPKGGDQILKILLCSILLFNKRVVQPTSMAYVKCMYEKGQIMWIMILTSCAPFKSLQITNETFMFQLKTAVEAVKRGTNTKLFETEKAMKVETTSRCEDIFALYRFNTKMFSFFFHPPTSKQTSTFFQSRAVQKNK